MALFNMGGGYKPKQFGFKPRYYDQDKEELQARLAKYDGEMDNAELMKQRIKSGFKYSSGGDRASHRAASRKSNIRLFIIIVALGLAAIIILQSEGITNMMKALQGGVE